MFLLASNLASTRVRTSCGSFPAHSQRAATCSLALPPCREPDLDAVLRAPSALAFAALGIDSAPGSVQSKEEKTVPRASLSTFLRHRWRRRVDRHEAAEHGSSKPRNQRWIDFLRSTSLLFCPGARICYPSNQSVELASMNNADDKSNIGRDWTAFVVAWIPYSLLTLRFGTTSTTPSSVSVTRRTGRWDMASATTWGLSNRKRDTATFCGSRCARLSSTWNSTLLSGHRCSVLPVALCSCTSFFER